MREERINKEGLLPAQSQVTTENGYSRRLAFPGRALNES